MKRYFVLLVFYLLCLTEAHSQQITFNRRYLLNPAAQITTYTVFCSILLSDSGYFVSGPFSDSVPPYQNGLGLAQIDFNGDIKSKTLYFMPNVSSFSTWSHSVQRFQQGFIHVGYAYTDSTPKQVLTFIDSTGIVFRQKMYPLDTPPAGQSLSITDIFDLNTDNIYIYIYMLPAIPVELMIQRVGG